MQERFCGQLKIELDVVGLNADEHLVFRGRVILGQDWWEFDNVIVQTEEDTPEGYDMAAAGAVHYGTLYTPDHDGPVPDWAPPEDFCLDAVCAVSADDKGYCIRREIDGPTTYSG